MQSLIEQRLAGLDNLMDEKFAGVEKQFTLVERQRVEQKVDAEKAIAAALQAAKEAVQEQTLAGEKSINKSENAATKNIDQLGQKFDTAFDGLRRDIDQVAQRVTVIEATRLGGREQNSDSNRSLMALIGLATIAIILIELVLKFTN